MERTRLSNNQIVIKILMLIFGIIFISTSFSPFQLGAILFGVFFEIIFGYIAFFAGDKIQFDKNHMYLIYRDGESQVELKNVIYIARQSITAVGLGKIKYLYDGKEYSAQFYPRYLSRAFKQFADEVLEKNPNATVYSNLGL
jgi:hypothetical protein